MKKTLAYSLLTLLLLTALWSLLPGQVTNPLTPYLLQARAWTFTALQTFRGGVDSSYDWTMADPLVAPTGANNGTTGGTCNNANNPHRVYVSWVNASGETLISPASADVTTTAAASRITVTRPTIDAKATLWRAWWSSNADGNVAVNACGISGGGDYVAAGTTTFICRCASTLGVPIPAVNGTHLSYGARLTQAILSRPELHVKEVCKSGCQYTTVTDALTAITDASQLNRYAVLIYPGDYDEAVTMKSYVSLVGVDRNSSRIRGGGSSTTISVPDTITEVAFENMTIGGGSPVVLQGNSTSTVYFKHVTLGIMDTSRSSAGLSVDGYVNQSGSNKTIYSADVLTRSNFDCVRLGGNDTVIGDGNVCEITLPSGSTTIRAWSTNNSANGVQIYENAPILRGTTDLAAASFNIVEINSTSPSSGTRPNRIHILNGDLEVNSTNVSASGMLARCVDLESVGTNTNLSEIDMSGTVCRLTSAGGTANLTGIRVVSDADHANWSIRWNGGRIVETGGSTMYDVDTNDSTSGFSINLGGLEHAGVYNGTGTGLIFPIDFRLGAFTTKLTGPTRDIAAGACTLGESVIDSGGATKEFCVCGTANTWGCWNLATGAFNAAGPAD